MKNVLIYCARGTAAVLANCPLFEMERVITASRWADVPSLAADADCLIVCVERSTPRQLDDLKAISRRKHRPAIVLVTERCPENVRLLRAVHADAVIWFGEVEELLVPTVRELLDNAIFEELAAEFAALPRMNAATAEAIRTALSAPRPIHRVSDLGNALRRDRGTIWHHWQNTLLQPRTMQELLDWILLLRALSARHAGVPWKRVMERLGVDRQKLLRLSTRILRCGVQDATALSQADLHDLFREHWFR